MMCCISSGSSLFAKVPVYKEMMFILLYDEYNAGDKKFHSSARNYE